MSLPSPTQGIATPPTGDDVLEQPTANVDNYELPLRLFQSHAQLKYRLLEEMLIYHKNDSREVARFGWIQLAAFVNPSAAFDFEIIAEAAESVQGPYNLVGEHADGNLRKSDPLSYLQDYQFGIPQRWTDILKGWELDLQRNRIAYEYRQHELQVQTLRKANMTLRTQLVQLKYHMGANFFREDPKLPDTYANPIGAMRAAQNLHVMLTAIEIELENFVKRLRIDATSLKDLQGHHRLANSGSGAVRRRQRGKVDESDDESDDEQPRSRTHSASRVQASQRRGDRTAITVGDFWTLLLRSLPKLPVLIPDQFGDLFSTVRHIVEELIKPSQNTLMVLAALVSVLSGIFTGVGFMQERPPECIPNQQTRDDGFYSLISQLLLQLLSLYCMLVPLIRDKAVDLRTWRFSMALVCSAAASIIAPATYGSSWKVSMVASFVSAFASLLASAQLAGWVEKRQKEPHHGH